MHASFAKSGKTAVPLHAVLPKDLKNFLARFGIKASFVARGEYKSAPETITNTGMSDANREETRAAFAADPSKVLRSATQRWPGIQQSLAE